MSSCEYCDKEVYVTTLHDSFVENEISLFCKECVELHSMGSSI